MGLDVYVGPLSRYYAGDWETIVQQVAKGSGIAVEIVRPKPPRRGWFKKLRDGLHFFRPTAEESVRRWRKRLRRDLGISDLDWNEDPETEYMTDKPAWDCYGALVLWAAYDELPAQNVATLPKVGIKILRTSLPGSIRGRVINT